jgi:hypothetical protein
VLMLVLVQDRQHACRLGLRGLHPHLSLWTAPPPLHQGALYWLSQGLQKVGVTTCAQAP